MYCTYFAICSLPARYSRLNEQRVSSLKLTPYISCLYKRSFRIPPNTYNTLQSTKFIPLKRKFVKFCIWSEFLDKKLSENSNFDTPEGVPTKARVLSKICNYGNDGFTFCVLIYFGYNWNVFEDFGGEKKNVQRVLVLNLVAISKGSLIFISILLKITLKQSLIQRPFVTFE